MKLRQGERRLREQKIGVLGGSFNPIHAGHLHIAREIQRLFALSQVHFVVAATPPHKQLENLIPLPHRYAMVALATAGSPSFIPSLVELEPPASPFSVDTMEKLVRSLGCRKADLYFIAGGDSLHDVSAWKESEKLLISYNFVFVGRPGFRTANAEDLLPGRAAARVRSFVGMGQTSVRKRIEEAGSEPGIYILDVNAPDVSATRIRELVATGKSIRRLVPEPVLEYINKLHLYGE